MREGARSVAGLAAACALLAGCSGDPGGAAATLPPITAPPTGEVTGAASPTSDGPTASSTVATPTVNADLGDEHVEDVEITMVNFLTALNHAKDTGDFSGFDALYTDACTKCVDLRAEVESWLANGGKVEGAEWVVMQQTSSLRSQGARADDFFLIYRTAGTVQDGAGAQRSAIEASPVQLGSAGMLSAEPWLLDGLGFTDYVE